MPPMRRPLRPAGHAATAALLLIAAACSASTALTATTAAPRDLDDARRLWAARRPAAYTVIMDVGCFCVADATRPVLVSVRGDSVQSRRYVAADSAVPPQYAAWFPTVEGLFARIDSIVAQEPERLEVEYDPTFGYPTRVAVDYRFGWADDEVTYTARDLQPR